MKALPKILCFFFILTTLLLFSGKWAKNIYAATNYWDFGITEGNEQWKEILKVTGTPVTLLPVNDIQQKASLFNFIRWFWCPLTEIDKNKSIEDQMRAVGCDPNKTALNNLSTGIAALYVNPPARFAWYLQDTFASAGLAKPVHAQGVGFAALTPMLSLWKAPRNIAYAVIVLVMVAIGFMVIFRMKIDPKTVISIQAALPKIIFTLVLITFSYAIVGFLIDLMYVAIALVVNVIGNTIATADQTKITDLQTGYMTGGWGMLWGSVAWGTWESIQNFITAGWALIFGPSAIAGIGAIITHFIAPTITSWFAIASIPALILVGIIILGIVYTFIRLFLLLLNSYIQILIALILGPLILLNEAIPGKSAFGEWIQNLIANLVVFPATVAIFMFSNVLASQKNAPGLWTPPLVGVTGPGDAGLISSFLSLGVILMAPTLVAQIKKAFGPKPALPISPGTLLSPLTSTFQTGMGAMSQFYYAQMLMQSLKGPGQPGREKR